MTALSAIISKNAHIIRQMVKCEFVGAQANTKILCDKFNIRNAARVGFNIKLRQLVFAKC